MKDPQKTNADLKELGEKGWELIVIWPDTETEGIAFFKRSIRE